MIYKKRGTVRAVFFDGQNHGEVIALGFNLEPTGADDRHAILRYKSMAIKVEKQTWVVDVNGIPITMKNLEFERLYEPADDAELVAS